MKLHIGHLIEFTLREQGRTVVWFANRLCCSRPNVYKIFEKASLDSSLIWRIGKILGHNFFRDIAQSFDSQENISGEVIPGIEKIS